MRQSAVVKPTLFSILPGAASALLIGALSTGCGATSSDGQEQNPDGTADAGTAVDAGAGGDGGSTLGDAGSPDAGMELDKDGPNQLITDRHFSRGFTAKGQVSGLSVGTMHPGFAVGDPIWNLGQWGSLTTLSDASPTTTNAGAKRWADSYGAVTIGLPGSGEADLSLRVNAHAEYGGVYYNGPDQVRNTWVHLLGEQSITSIGVPQVGCPPLSELKSLDFSVDSRLLQDLRHLQAGHNAGKHAAQYLLYFTIQNRAVNTVGYGDYLWFGLTLHDDRDDYPGLMVAGDDATGKLIYNIGLQDLSPVSLGDQQWHSLSEDLLPHIRLALLEAWDRGYLSGSNRLSDYRIGGMNLGWEIPGLNDAELELSDLSLLYSKHPVAELRYDFATDANREGWTISNLTSPTGEPTGGVWTMTVPASDPSMRSPDLQIDAASYSSISITIANNANPVGDSVLQLFWSRFGAPGFRESDSAAVAISNNGESSTYTIDLSALPGWTGEITQLRIDPILSGNGNTIAIDSIVLTP